MDSEEQLLGQGDRVREIINRERLSQAEFSQITGIKTSTLNHVIKGRNNISSVVMRQILSAFPMYNEEWIRTGTGEMLVINQIDGSSQLNSISSEKDSVAQNSLFSNISSSNSPYRCNVKDNDLNCYLVENKQNAGSPYSCTSDVLKSENIKRKIAKIIVYYTDNTFETFVLSNAED